jgi:hypothetical protein
MFTIYRILSLTFIAFFILTMTLVPMYSSMVTFKSMKASQEKLGLNAPHSKDNATTSYY